jgi:hypothetical protein
MILSQHDMASSLFSLKISDKVLRMHEEMYITQPLLAALSKLQSQLEATGNTEVPFKRVPYNKTPRTGLESAISAAHTNPFIE